MDRQIRSVERWGLVSGVTGCVANALLAGLWISIGTGDQDFRWTGPANDIVGGIVSTAAGIPFVIALTAVADDTTSRQAARIAVLGQGALVGSSALLVAGVLPFEQQVFIAMPAILTVFAWTALVGRSRSLPAGLARAARVVGGAALAGTGLALAAWPLPQGSVAQYVVGGAALLVGIPAYLAFPVWQLRVSARLRAGLTPAPEPQLEAVAR